MNRTKTFLPIIILTIGLLGLLFFPQMIFFDGGLVSDLNIWPRSEYKNADGETLYTIQQVTEHLELYAKTRSSLWALDVLSVYMFFHGLLGIIFNRKEIGLALQASGGKKSLGLHLAASIPAGILFGFLIARLIWQLGMPLH